MSTLSNRYLNNLNMTREEMIKWDNLIGMLNVEVSTKLVEVSEYLAVKYDGDLYGLLMEDIYAIEPQFLYPTMRVNGFNSPGDYNRNIRVLRLLDSEVIRKMLLTINKKS